MIGKARNALALAAFLAVGAQPTVAQGTGSLTSNIQLEKATPSSNGQPPKRTNVSHDAVVPGDRIRVALTLKNNGTAPAAGVNLVNPIPEGLMFDDTADTVGFGVSTDGGKTFGALAALTVPVEGAVPRAATAADVTHVRWLWPDAIGPGKSRSVAYFGRVR